MRGTRTASAATGGSKRCWAVHCDKMARLQHAYNAMTRYSFALLLGVTLAVGAAGTLLAQPSFQEVQPADKQLYDLIARDWADQKEYSPALAQFTGDRSRMNAWPDLSEPRRTRLAKQDLDRLASLRGISSRKLTPTARVDYLLFERELLNRQQEFRAKAHLTSFWQFDRFGPAVLRLIPFVGSAPPPETADELRGRVSRLRAFPQYVTQEIDLLRRSREQRMLPAKEVVRTVQSEIDKELAADWSQSAFCRTLVAHSVRKEETPSLVETVRTVFSDQVRPSLLQLRTFLADEYLPSCPDSPSLAGWPNCAELHGLLIRLSTTTSLTAEQLHSQGLSEVARIRTEMEKAIRDAGFSGSVKDFASKVNSDAKFHFKTEEELLTGYRSTIERIQAQLPSLFDRIPEKDLVLEPRKFGGGGPGAVYVPAATNGSRSAKVLVNVSNLDLRPKFEMVALMLHEALSGHHLQKSLEMQRSRTSVAGTAIQRLRRSEAFSEGWALYAESLGHEMGLYSDPYERYGRLSYEMVRAVRVVIDTGIHAKGWSREEAVRYFMEQTGKPAALAEGEVLRAIWDPGSLVAYKAGELALKTMRARARAQLGKAFSVRDFHSFVLREGSLPLDVLQTEFEAWLRERVRAAKPKSSGQR